MHTPALDTAVTGLQTFNLLTLSLPSALAFQLPNKLRLGHLTERVVAELIRASANYKVLHENIQIRDGNDTVGELDFIIEHQETQEQTHLELAYKFYLYDPSLSTAPINCWIGPNRNDSLSKKLQKLKTKQFPLLFDKRTAGILKDLDISTVSQMLCLLVSLYVPYNCDLELGPEYLNAVKGYYLNFEMFAKLDDDPQVYYLPPKKEWGMKPATNDQWSTFDEIIGELRASLHENRAPLCWQKNGDSYSEYFVTWW